VERFSKKKGYKCDGENEKVYMGSNSREIKKENNQFPLSKIEFQKYKRTI
jgi:hypothetical protein